MMVEGGAADCAAGAVVVGGGGGTGEAVVVDRPISWAISTSKAVAGALVGPPPGVLVEGLVGVVEACRRSSSSRWISWDCSCIWWWSRGGSQG